MRPARTSSPLRSGRADQMRSPLTNVPLLDPTSRTHQPSPSGSITDDRVVAFVREMGESGKPLAFICHAGSLLIEADLVRGRRVTSWPSIRTDLINAGAEWVDAEVVEDGNLISSRRPDDLAAFGEAILRRL